MLSRFSRLSRPKAIAVCALPVAALLAVVGLAPLPFAVAQPGSTANVLGNGEDGKPVITISGAPTRKTSGQLRMTTIVATGPQMDVYLSDVIDGWFREDRAVMPKDSVYPDGDDVEKVEKHNLGDMKKSQDAATRAALSYLSESGVDTDGIDVDVDLGKIGGPSAGLFLALGIIDKLDGDGSGKDLTGGRTIAGTGTITAGGKVGPVGGVELKVQAARRDGATVFLVPKGECSEAQGVLPKGLRLVPVSTLRGTLDALRALEKGGKVPSC